MSEQKDASQVTTGDAQKTQDDGQQSDQQYNDEKLHKAFYGKTADDEAESDDSSDDKDEESKDQDDDESTDDQDADENQDESDKDKDENADDDKGDDKDVVLSKPKDSQLSDADMERIAQFAKEQGLSKEAAQKLVEDESSSIGSFFQRLQDEHRQATEQWVQDVRSDKELGGDNYKQSVEYAKRVVKRFGSEKLIKDLNATGYGNHPEVVRVFARIGKAMEGTEEVKSGQNSKAGKSVAEQFYPSNANN